jgi:hypothetical protein
MNLDVSVAVYSGLSQASDKTGLHRSILAVRCIEVAHKLESAIKAGHEIYHLDQLLPIRLPTPGGPLMHTLQVPYSLEIYRGLNEVTSYFRIKPCDVVAWGLDMMPDIEQSLRIDDIFVVQPSGPARLTLSWFNQKQSQ